MTRLEVFRKRAKNYAALARKAVDLNERERLRRVEKTWQSLAGVEAWLDTQVSPFAIRAHRKGATVSAPLCARPASTGSETATVHLPTQPRTLAASAMDQT